MTVEQLNHGRGKHRISRPQLIEAHLSLVALDLEKVGELFGPRSARAGCSFGGSSDRRSIPRLLFSENGVSIFWSQYKDGREGMTLFLVLLHITL